MKSFLSDRPRVTTPALALHLNRAGAGLDSALRGSKCLEGSLGSGVGGSGGSASQIECIRQGDKITRLVVTCGCGERIEINCLYAGV